MQITVRKATSEELPAILALYSQIDQEPILELADAQRLWERIKHYPNYAIYVALAENVIVGTFALLIMDNLGHLGAPSGIVEDVIVDAAHRGQGIGKHMMEFAMETCRTVGCYKLVLSSNLKREDAHRFYEELGFDKHGYSFLVRFAQ